MKLKRTIQYFFQQLLGIDQYLFLTALFQWYFIRIFFPDRELNFFIEHLKHTGIVVDAGANLGITSLMIARQRPNCTILAFEPVPSNIRCLKRMVRLFSPGNIKIYESALANCSGQLLMSQPVEQRVLMHGLSRVVETPDFNQKAFDVPALSLDDIPELQHAGSFVGMKMDVENFEWYVFQGGVEVIRASRPIIYCEIWGTVRRNLTLQLMLQLGYSAYIFKGKKLESFQEQQALNFFLLPDATIGKD
jgi:FkbM family methyltransferase